MPTRYVMKQDLISFGDDFTIKNEDGDELYSVDGKAFTLLREKLAFKDRANAARQPTKQTPQGPRSRRRRRLNQVPDKFITLESLARPQRLGDGADSQIDWKSLHPSPDPSGIMLGISHLRRLRRRAPARPRTIDLFTPTR
jgi:hypothetical protein